jgi:CBS domain-containing protein
VNNWHVIDLMVPLSEYATVFEGDTLLDAVLALEKAQEAFDHTRYRHRGILVLDHNKHVVGKLGPLDVLKAIDLKDTDQKRHLYLKTFGFSSRFIRRLERQSRRVSPPVQEICRKAVAMKVEDFMQAPTKIECIDGNATVKDAIHHMVMRNHLSLLVTENDEIVGILRLADVFAALFHEIKTCTIDHQKER